MPEHFMGKQLFDKHKHNVIENEKPNLKDQLNIFGDFTPALLGTTQIFTTYPIC